MKTRIVFFVMFCFAVLFVNAQNTGDTILVKIETTDGNEFIGQVMSDDSTKTVLKTEKLGEITILKTDIKHTESVQIKQIKRLRIKKRRRILPKYLGFMESVYLWSN
jgi:hypothetical protein